jgi:hypothetical protein
MSVLSLFHPQPGALKPGYTRKNPEPVSRPLPTYKDAPKPEDKTEEKKEGPPKVTDPNMKFLEYKVRATDDLDVWNIAATYGVRVEDIRRYNRRVVFDYLDNVIGETIYIPINVQEGDHIPKQPEADPKKIAEFKFVKDTGCSHAEAKYYLEDAEWDYDNAMKTFRDDVAWEKSKDSRDKALQMDKLKLESGTPTEKLASALSPPKPSAPPAPTTTTTISSDSDIPSMYPTIPSSHSNINFPPPSYSFEGLQSSTSMQPITQPTVDISPPSWEESQSKTTQLKSLKKPLLENSYS